ncbi:hypothetical protein HXX01_05310 [Candidatus Nomurabacteria bacterium]|nr:hypothetical protein [Candidatus Nomurabacteria bacterium]
MKVAKYRIKTLLVLLVVQFASTSSGGSLSQPSKELTPAEVSKLPQDFQDKVAQKKNKLHKKAPRPTDAGTDIQSESQGSGMQAAPATSKKLPKFKSIGVVDAAGNVTEINVEANN